MKTHKYQHKTPEERIMEQLHLDLTHWQRELRLDDIDIELRWMQWDEYPGKVGYWIDYSNSQLIEISFRQPIHKRSMDGVREFNSSYEVILVHELIHARNSRWYSGEVMEILGEGVSNELYEISVDAIAEALVRARRGMNR
jgi:hypothetical protein